MTQDVEKEFFTTLSLVKSKDAKIYDKNVKFFDKVQENKSTDGGKEQSENSSSKKRKEKAFFLKDMEREIILKKFLLTVLIQINN